MRKWLKWGLWGIVIITLLIMVTLSKLKPIDADTTIVNRENVLATVDEKGKIVSKETKDIFSELQGKIKALNVDVGDSVSKGSVLAVVDAGDIESQLAQLEGELKSSRGAEEASFIESNNNQIKQQQEALNQAQTALNLSKQSFERTQKLFNEGAVGTVELEQAKADYETKQQARAEAEAVLAQTISDFTRLKKQKQGTKLQYQGQVESLQAKIKYLEEQKRKANIIAPASGTVLVKKISAGDYVSPGMVLFTLGNVKELNIETYFNSEALINAKKGDNVIVTFKTAGADIKTNGTITKIAPLAEEKTSALGILEDKIKVNIELVKKPEGIGLIPGATADVTLITQQASKVIAVPKDVVFSDNGKDYLWLVKNGQASLVLIEKGMEGDDLIEVKNGLQEGEHVILNPHQTDIKEGIKVKEHTM